MSEPKKSIGEFSSPSIDDDEDRIGLALALCHRLQYAATWMTFRQFHEALHAAIGCSKEYSEGVMLGFQNNPAAFLASRNPQSQSHELIRAILELTTEARQ